MVRNTELVVLEAIRNVWITSADLFALTPGGFWLVKAPGGTAYPFITVTLQDSVPDETLTSVMEVMGILLSAFSRDVSVVEVGNILAGMKRTYDECVLLVKNHDTIRMHRTAVSLSDDPDDGGWQAVCRYEVRVQERSLL